MDHFTKSVLESGLQAKNIIQVSMDGPSVNWKLKGMSIKPTLNAKIFLSWNLKIELLRQLFKFLVCQHLMTRPLR